MESSHGTDDVDALTMGTKVSPPVLGSDLASHAVRGKVNDCCSNIGCQTPLTGEWC